MVPIDDSRVMRRDALFCADWQAAESRWRLMATGGAITYSHPFESRKAAERWLRTLLPTPATRHMRRPRRPECRARTPFNIIRLVAEVSGVSIGELVSSSTEARVAQARRVAMLLIRRHVPGISLAAVGREFGRRYNTVCVAEHRAAAECCADGRVADLVAQVERRLRSK